MAKTETDISTLKINYLSESAYKTALSNGEINENEIYMTPSDETNSSFEYNLDSVLNKRKATSTDKITLISFIDDDCRIETYNTLFPIIKETGIPYAVACPAEQIGTTNYMSLTQLKEMCDAGVEVTSHHLKQYNMNQFTRKSDYESELQTCEERFKDMGLQVKTICYPQGVYVSSYMNVVNKFYSAGFIVDRGVNQIPLESLFLKRVEVFPTSEIYSLDDVKLYVDNAISTGGWLIFMTHAWYTTFDASKLKELIQYIQGKSVEIVGINEALNRIGNVEEYGVIKKPLEYISEPFYCVDASGKVYTNSQKFYQASNNKMVRVQAGYNAGYNLATSGKTVSNSDKKRMVSEKITVSSGEKYLISASNVYGNALYVIYNSSNAVIKYEAAANTANGTVITDKEITIPSNASYMKLSTNLSIQPDGYSICKLETTTSDRDLMDTTLTKEGVPADAKATGDAISNLKKNDTKVTNTLNTTTKAYVTGTTSSSTNTGTQIFDTGVYLDTIAGRLTATSFKVGNAVLTYNSSENALIISFV